MSTAFSVFKAACSGFSEDKLPTLGAALAYCTIFSIAPLLIIAIAVAGYIFGAQASSGAIYATVSDLVGDHGARAIQDMVESASKAPTTGVVSTIIGFTALLLGATGVFAQLQDSLNLIWRVQPVPGRGVLSILHQRLLSLSMVMVFAFLLLTSLLVSAALSAAGQYFSAQPTSTALWQALNISVSFLVITLLFAAIFKVLPDVHLAWGDVWRGAAVTALLFTLGKFLIGLYIGRSGVMSSYGAAGSIIGVLLWVYYSSEIVLFGAEITRAYVRQTGHELLPKAHAEFRPELDAAKTEKAPVNKVLKAKS